MFLDVLAKQLGAYLDDISKVATKTIFSAPNTVGWKVADIDEFNQVMAELIEQGIAQAHIGRVNGRYIASLVLNEDIHGVSVLKLMQRRPGSDDPIGLDHVDFLVPSMGEAEKELKQLDLIYEKESNQKHSWFSVDVSGREAKLVDHTVLDVCIAELSDEREALLNKHKLV